jgi:type II secretory pathway pseudopilin PulG
MDALNARFSIKNVSACRIHYAIELLIVVAIILIIAAIAFPNLLRSRMAANEASAVGSLRTINTACVTYSTNYPNIGYPATLAAMGPAASAASTSADLMDNVLAGGTKSGYTFAYCGHRYAFDRVLGDGKSGQPRHFGPAWFLHRPIRCDPLRPVDHGNLYEQPAAVSV